MLNKKLKVPLFEAFGGMNRVKNVIQCFFNLAKTSHGKKHMTKLKHPEGSVTVDPKLILGEMRHFYQQLYSSQGHTPAVLSNFLNFESLPKLDSVSKASVRIRLLEEECLFALKSFQRNTSPGTDGFFGEALSLFLEWDLQPPSLQPFNWLFQWGAFWESSPSPETRNHLFDSTTNILCFLKTGGLPLSSETQITNLQRNVSQNGSKKFFPISQESKRPSRLHQA